MDTSEVQGLTSRLEAIEWNIARLLTLANLAWEEPPRSDGVDQEILELVRAGNKIGAIKRYREVTGADLGTAKAAVEQIL